MIFLWRGCMIFFWQRGCVIIFVESLRDFVCGEFAWFLFFVCGGCVIFLCGKVA